MIAPDCGICGLFQHGKTGSISLLPFITHDCSLGHWGKINTMWFTDISYIHSSMAAVGSAVSLCFHIYQS